MPSTDRNTQLVRQCHLASLLLLAVFSISVPTFLTCVYQAAYDSEFGEALTISAAFAVATSGLGYPLAIILREGFAYSRFAWRFTTYQLLCLMTGTAIALGVFVCVLRVL
jgi:hypothetical protein